MRPASSRTVPFVLNTFCCGVPKLARLSRLKHSKRSCSSREPPTLTDLPATRSTVRMSGPTIVLRGSVPMKPAAGSTKADGSNQ